MVPGKGKEAPATEIRVERAGEFSQAWQDLRGDDAIQFQPVEVAQAEQSQPPDWLLRFLEWLADLFTPVGRLIVAIWPVLMWALIAAGLALVAYFLWQLIDPGAFPRRGKRVARDEWVPDQIEALALLEEADRLAAEGHYDEATRLLLKRSVGQIAAARPDIVEPSSTARELSAEPRLPDAARSAFAVIAGRVERSLFALTRLSQDDWRAAREAYAEFALQQRALAA